jgi:Protein of unknown function (DUF3379)
MNHNEARMLLGAEPDSPPSPELTDHLANCAECSQFQGEMVALEANIRRALQPGPVATAAAAPIASVTPLEDSRAKRAKQATNVWSGWALAASVAVASVIIILALRPADTLAHDIVAHVEYESDSWLSKQPVSPAAVNKTLAKAGVALDMSSDKVMYARTCMFRGHLVPHLVVHTPRGPVTVLVLSDEKVAHRTDFHEDGMTGVITPAPHGSIAVLALGNENVDAAAEEVQQSVRWLPRP